MTDLDHILNWRRRDAATTLSGQPTEAQMAQIAATGVTHIINLGPHDNKGALDDEAKTTADLDMTYIYIPVDFDAPTEADYAAFQAALTETAHTRRHVHCIYNARVSAFFYRLDQTDLAFDLMDGIWKPGGVWATFIGKPNDADLKNRYAGYDY